MTPGDLIDPAPTTGDALAVPTKADWIELIAIYRAVNRANTGWRFASLEWTR